MVAANFMQYVVYIVHIRAATGETQQMNVDQTFIFYSNMFDTIRAVPAEKMVKAENFGFRKKRNSTLCREKMYQQSHLHWTTSHYDHTIPTMIIYKYYFLQMSYLLLSFLISIFR